MNEKDLETRVFLERQGVKDLELFVVLMLQSSVVRIYLGSFLSLLPLDRVTCGVCDVGDYCGCVIDRRACFVRR